MATTRFSDPVRPVDDEKSNDSRSLLAALYFTFVTNIDMTTILTFLPVAIFHGGTVSPVFFSMALSIQVVASLIGGISVPTLLSNMNSSWMLLVSATLKSAGFVALLATVDPPGLFTFAILAGLGRGVSKVAVRVLITDATTEKSRARAFQWFFIIMNAALLLAPLLADLLVDRNMVYLSLIILIVVEMVSGAWAGASARSSHSAGIVAKKLTFRGSISFLFHSLSLAILSYTLVVYFALGFVMAMFFLYRQVNPSLANFRSLFLSFEPFVLIIIQLIMIPLWAKVRRSVIYTVSAVFGGAGLFLSFTSSVQLVLIGLTLFAFSECLAMPQAQLEASAIEPREKMTIMLSAVTITSAVGEIMGNVAAGWIVDKAGTFLPSATVSAMGVAMVVFLGLSGTGWSVMRASSSGRDIPPAAAGSEK